MMKRVFGSTALFSALLAVFCFSGAAQAQQKYLGLAQPGVPPKARKSRAS